MAEAGREELLMLRECPRLAGRRAASPDPPTAEVKGTRWVPLADAIQNVGCFVIRLEVRCADQTIASFSTEEFRNEQLAVGAEDTGAYPIDERHRHTATTSMPKESMASSSRSPTATRTGSTAGTTSTMGSAARADCGCPAGAGSAPRDHRRGVP
jgi:hypothetical protein